MSYKLSNEMRTALAEIARFGSTDQPIPTVRALKARGLVASWSRHRDQRVRRSAGIDATLTAAGTDLARSLR